MARPRTPAGIEVIEGLLELVQLVGRPVQGELALGGEHHRSSEHQGTVRGASVTPSVTLGLSTLMDVKTFLSRVLMSAGCLVAVVASRVVLATPAEAATFTVRCVFAREMRIYHTATSSTAGRTRLYFGTTVWKDKKSHGRIRVYWWTLTEGWHRGWISAYPSYTRPGECGTIT